LLKLLGGGMWIVGELEESAGGQMAWITAPKMASGTWSPQAALRLLVRRLWPPLEPLVDEICLGWHVDFVIRGVLVRVLQLDNHLVSTLMTQLALGVALLVVCSNLLVARRIAHEIVEGLLFAESHHFVALRPEAELFHVQAILNRRHLLQENKELLVDIVGDVLRHRNELELVA